MNSTLSENLGVGKRRCLVGPDDEAQFPPVQPLPDGNGFFQIDGPHASYQSRLAEAFIVDPVRISSSSPLIALCMTIQPSSSMVSQNCEALG